MPNVLDCSQGCAIHGMFNRDQDDGVLPAQDYPKVEEVFTLHFDEGASFEIRILRSGQESEPQALFFASFHAARMSVSVGQLPDHHPFILFQHRFDYTLYSRCLRWMRRIRRVPPGSRSSEGCERLAPMKSVLGLQDQEGQSWKAQALAPRGAWRSAGAACSHRNEGSPPVAQLRSQIARRSSQRAPASHIGEPGGDLRPRLHGGETAERKRLSQPAEHHRKIEQRR
jgi:hypothetical protein